MSSSTRLPRLPLPKLEETLRSFEASRRAVDSEDEQKATRNAVEAFLHDPGPSLQHTLKETPPHTTADAYERLIYLNRREPLQDYSTFFIGHATDAAPQHSQADRAAILTIAVAEFARKLSSGEIPADILHGKQLSTESRRWLFYTIRRPHQPTDSIERHLPNHTVVVLRRGYVFLLRLSAADDVPLQLEPMRAAYSQILEQSQEEQPHSARVCVLTADDRDSWDKFRRDLETDNATLLEAIDQAAFVVCLDDEAPRNSSERYVQFLLNGKRHPFANRWLDKPLQLAVTANGASATICEHTKLDGLHLRTLQSHLCQAIVQAQVSNAGSTDGAPAEVYPFQKHTWKSVDAAAVVQRIHHIQDHCRRLRCDIECLHFDCPDMGLGSLENLSALPGSVAYITVLLALYLVDGDIRPAWEIVTLARYLRGRLDWIQIISPPMRDFLEYAVSSGLVRKDSAQISNDHDVLQRAQTLFQNAVTTHAAHRSAAARGRGFVGHLYALLGAALASDDSQSWQQQDISLPALFRTEAWRATQRGGPSQEVKIGILPEDSADPPYSRWEEGGFLMPGDRGVYIHCFMRRTHARFAVAAEPNYAKAVTAALGPASRAITALLA